jgi:hypothetical protein
MTLQSDLCMEPIKATDGVRLGIPGYPASYRFVVQAAVVTVGNLLGTFVLGSGVLGGPRWVDLTHSTEGLTWNRGGEPAERPIAGEMNIRLNNDHDEWSPWTSPFFGPGTMIRCAIGDETTLLAQFCGTSISWNEASAGLEAYNWVDIVVWENMFLLSEVNDHALDGVIGGGDTFTQRVDRLLDQAEWAFGREIMSTSAAHFQASDFAQDVATNLYLTVDSVDVVVFSDKDGMLMFHDRGVGSGISWELHQPDQDTDSIVTANDDDRILSSVDLARVGGTVITYENHGIAGKYQRRSQTRTDLITVAEPGDADLARVADGMLSRARQTYRPVTFAIESGQGVNQSRLIVEADITDRLTLFTGLPHHDQLQFSNYSICGMAIEVQFGGGGVYMRGTFTMDIEADSAWEVIPAAFAVWDTTRWDGSERWR